MLMPCKLLLTQQTSWNNLEIE